MTTRRKDNIRFKLMPDGHIHAYQAHKHNSGAGEWHMATSFCRGGSPCVTTGTANERKIVIIERL